MVNKAIVLGYVGQDPDVRELPNKNVKIAKFSLATTRTSKDANGNKQQDTEWHNIVAFGRQAEIIGEYVRKGSRLYIEGSLKTEQWEKDGVIQKRTTIRLSSMQMLGSPQDKPQSRPANQQGNPQGNQQQGNPQGNGYQDLDDDIPF